MLKAARPKISIKQEVSMRLMISVVSADEAREALEGGAEILDVKNPDEGSLGANVPSVIREVRATSLRGEVSAAIGDIPNLPGTAALAALGAASCGIDYVKVGLRGPRTESDALRLLQEVQRAVTGFETSVIAAAYADFLTSGTIHPLSLPAIAAAAGVRGCLLDTAVKDGRSLFSFLSPDTLGLFVEEAHQRGLLAALAGSLREDEIPLVQQLGADIVGLRSLVCRGFTRSGPLEAARIRHLRQILVPAV